MKTVKLGKTGIVVNKNGFGALPIQRVPMDQAILLLRKAYQNGITFYDSARGYTDSEAKLGNALSDVRDKIVIATKSGSHTAEALRKDLAQSLATLKTDYIDIYQLHNPPFCPKPGDGSGLYEAMLEARQQGKIRHIGITNHRLEVAREAIESGLYETLQFPFSHLATPIDLELVQLCQEREMGFIAMKAMSGGLITDSALAYAYMAQFDHVIPIWGIQRESELDEFISYQANPPSLDEAMQKRLEDDRKALAGEFCRGCGYCLPCPAEIQINLCARMGLLLRRSPQANWLSPAWQAEMKKVEDCQHCNQCIEKCPYGLNPPELIAKNYEDYLSFLG